MKETTFLGFCIFVRCAERVIALQKRIYLANCSSLRRYSAALQRWLILLRLKHTSCVGSTSAYFFGTHNRLEQPHRRWNCNWDTLYGCSWCRQKMYIQTRKKKKAATQHVGEEIRTHINTPAQKACWFFFSETRDGHSDIIARTFTVVSTFLVSFKIKLFTSVYVQRIPSFKDFIVKQWRILLCNNSPCLN